MRVKKENSKSVWLSLNSAARSDARFRNRCIRYSRTSQPVNHEFQKLHPRSIQNKLRTSPRKKNHRDLGKSETPEIGGACSRVGGEMRRRRRARRGETRIGRRRQSGRWTIRPPARERTRRPAPPLSGCSRPRTISARESLRGNDLGDHCLGSEARSR